MSNTVIIIPTSTETVLDVDRRRSRIIPCAGAALLNVLPILLIVGGALCLKVICPCKNYGCTVKDAPYILPIPKVGVPTDVWLIVNGVSYNQLITAGFFVLLASVVAGMVVFVFIPFCMCVCGAFCGKREDRESWGCEL